MSDNKDLEDLQRERVENLVKYEDGLINLQSPLAKVFSEVFVDNTGVSENIVYHRIAVTLTQELEESKEELQGVARDLVQFIYAAGELSIQLLREHGASKELVNVVGELISAYRLSINRYFSRIVQGDKYWSSVDTEIAIRDESTVGFTHKIARDFDDSVEFDASLATNIDLIRHLLRQQYIGIQVGPQNTSSINRENISLIKGYVNAIERFLGEEIPPAEIE